MAKLVFLNKELKRVLFIPDMCQEIRDYFGTNQDAVLIINFSEIREYGEFYNFSCLNGIKINNLRLSGNVVKDYNFDALLKMQCLKELDNREVDLEYDFLNFPNLEIIRYTWNKKCRNIASLKKARELSLWAYRHKNQNLIEFKNMTSIEEIRFIQSTIKSIEGMETLPNLKTVSFVANRSLSFEESNHVFESVEDLYIESCRNIALEKVLQLFPNLKVLTYHSNEQIESLKPFLDGFQKLEKLNIAGVLIKEEDNRYWKNYKNLKEFNFSDRKHQLLKRSDF